MRSRSCSAQCRSAAAASRIGVSSIAAVAYPGREPRFANAPSGYDAAVGYTPSENLPELIDTMKRACAALDDAGVPAMLGGGLATWARGGPPTDHDVDFYLSEETRRGARRARRSRDDDPRRRRRAGC